MTNIWMLINGTWVDVTGRIVIPDIENIFDNMVSGSKTIVGEWRMFQNSTTTDNGTITATNNNDILAHNTVYTGSGLFNEVWAPHESRLLVFIGNRLTGDPEAQEELKNGDIAIHILSQTRLVNYIIDGVFMDTSAVVNEIQQIQLQPDGEFYVYNAVLNQGETFQIDQWGTEVFIQPRS